MLARLLARLAWWWGMSGAGRCEHRGEVKRRWLLLLLLMMLG